MAKQAKSPESVSFGFKLEEYMKDPVLLYRLERGEGALTTRGSKHTIFYVKASQPRHFRHYFSKADYALVICNDLCAYLLERNAFILAEHVSQFKDMRRILAVLHFKPKLKESERVYLDQYTFTHLFTSSLHSVGGVYLEYHNDEHVGQPFRVKLSRKRARVSTEDLYIAYKFKNFPHRFIAVYEGRGWITVIADAC